MSEPTDLEQEMHEFGLTATWVVLFNIGIFFILMKQKYFSYYGHAVIGVLILGATYGFVLELLAPYGFLIVFADDGWFLYIHAIIGIALLGLTVIQVLLGLVARLTQEKTSSPTARVLFLKKVHRILGYSMALLYKVNILWSWGQDLEDEFYYVLAWEIVCITLLIYFKFFLSRAENTIIPFGQEVQEILSLEKIKSSYLDYVIFADRVYNIEILKKHHPAGYQIIESVRGREIDRFIYGMYGAETMPEISAHSHSKMSLELVSPPLAYYNAPATYSGFQEEIVDVDVDFAHRISNDIVLLGLTPRQYGVEFVFKGYSDLRQLGQYYSLTTNDKITRLYTALNTAHHSNLELMDQLFPTLGLKEIKTLCKAQTQETQMMDMSREAAFHPKKKQQSDKLGNEYLPIMMKIYPDGKLTSLLQLNEFTNLPLKLSKPRGQGLELHSLKPGKIIILAGGTGLFPFTDFIDLFFKAQLLQQKHPQSQRILKLNPLLKSKPFENFTVHLMLAVNRAEDVYPLTLNQMMELCKDGNKFAATMRISDQSCPFLHEKTAIKFTRDYFGKKVLEEAGQKGCSKIWICGPPRLNTETVLSLISQGFKEEQYQLI